MTFATASAVRDGLIGSKHALNGPFGAKPMVYADSTASGKALSFIEDYIRDAVLPFYANTHTETSTTGLQTTRFREDARNRIRVAVNAPKEEYAVIFTGSGATGAINKLAHILGMSPLSPDIEDSSKRVVVFISHQEHHSNELIWREAKNVDLVVVPQDSATGALDIDFLEEELQRYHNRSIKLGSFSAASNVTGIRCTTTAVTSLLHHYGALSVWDFAAAGPHVGINIAGENLDGIYLSPHKYIGGPGSPGLLIARRSLFRNRVPDIPGGGTVRFVQPHGHQYIDDVEHREEGGTPAIIESIRAGLVLQLHRQIGPDWIEKTEAAFLDRAFSTWCQNPNMVILGNQKAKRVPIVSFLVKSPTDSSKYLHHNFVVALLNDLFGIQARGGCSCAGPLGHELLHIDRKMSDIIVKGMGNVGEALKPGWTRLGFAYHMNNEVVDYIIAAVDLIARQGYKLLPQYRLDLESGSWTHINSLAKPMSLWDFSSPYPKVEKISSQDLKRHLEQARLILGGEAPKVCAIPEALLPGDQFSSDLRWFIVALPQTCPKFLTHASEPALGIEKPPQQHLASRSHHIKPGTA